MVGTLTGGLDDIITPEVGRLVPVDDAKALAEGIMELLTLNVEQKSEMQLHCIRHVETRFSWAATALNTEQIYLNCLPGEDITGEENENRKN